MLDAVPVRQQTHPPSDASVLEDVVLNDPDGNAVRLGDLWAERPAVLVFLRHFGCVFCRQLAVDIHNHRHEFAEADVELAMIGFGPPEHAREFLQKQNVDLRLLLDPDRKVYELAGAKVATLKEVIGPLQIWRGLVATIGSRIRQGSIAVNQGVIRTHAAQLGGALVIAPDGSVRYAYLSEQSGDNPRAQEVLAAARAIRPHLNSGS
ncbi:MAG TPA: peroxiredoxin-like family protein [Thermoleophilaceae bacterium]|nr:peroxiredoxin-like family protein [Thermoleophilaceae bacterium]